MKKSYTFTKIIQAYRYKLSLDIAEAEELFWTHRISARSEHKRTHWEKRVYRFLKH